MTRVAGVWLPLRVSIRQVAPCRLSPATKLSHRRRLHTHTHTHTHTRAHTKGRSHILARARPRGGGAGGEDAQRPFRAPGPGGRGRSQPPFRAAGLLLSLLRGPTKWGRRRREPACGLPGARGGLGPARSRSPPQPRAKLGGRRINPARARARAPQLFTGPVWETNKQKKRQKKKKKKRACPTPPWWRRRRRQEWLLSLILVYSEKLQTGRV